MLTTYLSTLMLLFTLFPTLSPPDTATNIKHLAGDSCTREWRLDRKRGQVMGTPSEKPRWLFSNDGHVIKTERGTEATTEKWSIDESGVLLIGHMQYRFVYEEPRNGRHRMHLTELRNGKELRAEVFEFSSPMVTPIPTISTPDTATNIEYLVGTSGTRTWRLDKKRRQSLGTPDDDKPKWIFRRDGRVIKTEKGTADSNEGWSIDGAATLTVGKTQYRFAYDGPRGGRDRMRLTEMINGKEIAAEVFEFSRSME